MTMTEADYKKQIQSLPNYEELRQSMLEYANIDSVLLVRAYRKATSNDKKISEEEWKNIKNNLKNNDNNRS